MELNTIEGYLVQIAESVNNALGYLYAEKSVTEDRRKSFKVITFPGKKAGLNIENRETEKSCPVVAEITTLKEDNMTEYRYRGYKITKRPDGRWWARLQISHKKKSVYGKDVAEVKRKITAAIKELKERAAAPEQKYSFFEWLQFWNDTYKKPHNRTDSITPQIKRHIFEIAQDKPLEKVTPIELQLLVNKVKTTRSRVAVNNIIKGAFNVALRTKVIKDNPATALVNVVHIPKKGAALTKDEEAKFILNIKDFYLAGLFKFYLLSGCRRSEALTLNIADIDYKNGSLKIHGTKTENSEREIPLFDKLRELLITLTPDKEGYIFSNVHEDTVTQSFKKFCPNHKLHDLRHTFATRCLEAGVNMKTVQVWLGHSRFETTANTYSHAQKEFQNEQALRLNNYFDTTSDTNPI